MTSGKAVRLVTNLSQIVDELRRDEAEEDLLLDDLVILGTKAVPHLSKVVESNNVAVEGELAAIVAGEHNTLRIDFTPSKDLEKGVGIVQVRHRCFLHVLKEHGTFLIRPVSMIVKP